MRNNPVIYADYPDPDVIRVGDTYYMVSTTMHFMPGCVILRSYDLVHWEFACHVYDMLDGTPGQRLEGDKHVYSKGMWAASLRYHKGLFYVCFVANDTNQTYLYTAEQIEGQWVRHETAGFYHDCSILFDDDDRVYLVHGNREIHLLEMMPDLSGPKPGGLSRMIVQETQPHHLGYEGAHFYKINGRYVVFFIHILKSGHSRRTQACFSADSLLGEFVGGDVFDDDMGYFNQGVAQGGIVDTPDGNWFAMLFQDRGALGRSPVLVPLQWEDNRPVLASKAPMEIDLPSTKADYCYAPLVMSDDFVYQPNKHGVVKLKGCWEWNHTPDNAFWSVLNPVGAYTITSGKLSQNLLQAVNTLTQRTMGPASEVQVLLDGSLLKDGDYAGVCLLISSYGFIAITQENGQKYLVVHVREAEDDTIFGNLVDTQPGQEIARIPLRGDRVMLRAVACFENRMDLCAFSYLDDDVWCSLGEPHKMVFKLDQFVGCRFGLFLMSTKETGGRAVFRNFQYQIVGMDALGGTLLSDSATIPNRN